MLEMVYYVILSMRNAGIAPVERGGAVLREALFEDTVQKDARRNVIGGWEMWNSR